MSGINPVGSMMVLYAVFVRLLGVLGNKNAAHVALHLENTTWLSRYPRPIHWIYDQGR